MKRYLPGLVWLTLTVILTAGIVTAQDQMQFPVQQFTLPNGLNFLVVERHTAPVFSGYISVAVGSAYEVRGDIGSAHLLEHMMFKGSQNIGTTNYAAESVLMAKEDSVWDKIDRARQDLIYIRLNQPARAEDQQRYIDSLKIVLDTLTAQSSQYVVQNEFDRIYTRNGAAEFNAETGYDRTKYYVSLPSNRVELWFAMESDRLKHPAFREFFPERDVVSEERRLSVENNPGSKLYEQLIGTAFIAHPYQVYWEWQSEENNLTRSDLNNFFKTYYIPQRMTIAVVGDVKLEEVKKLAEKYFGDIPAGKQPEPIYTVEPPQPGERRVDAELDGSPTIYIAYHAVAFNSSEQAPFQVIGRLLGDGRTSRLYKALVIDNPLCLDISVGAFPGGELGDDAPDIFVIYAYPKEGVTLAAVEKGVYDELAKLDSTPVSDHELQKIKNRLDAEFIWGFYSNLGLADRLATAQNQAHDWHYLLKMRNNLKAVTAADIMTVAKKYFTSENRTVATLIPKVAGGAE
ncbi:Peptidase M16 domain protein [Candidatus Zixiibacteriota bacterium]|nr:Peptidase M16 domain protein [candidate division Zixibacteria bacterium]